MRRFGCKAAILRILAGKSSPFHIRKQMKDFHPREIASALDAVSCREREVLYRALSVSELASVLAYTDRPVQYIKEMNIRFAARVIAEFEPELACRVLRECGHAMRSLLLSALPDEDRSLQEMLLSYEEDTVAGKMSTQFVSMPYTAQVREAIAAIAEAAREHENLSVLYLESEEGIYYGAVSLQRLLLANRESTLDKIAVVGYPCVYEDDGIETALEVLRGDSALSVPVLSEENRILGAVTPTDLLDALDEELSDDYAKLAGLTEEEDADEPLFCGVKKRLPWLSLLLVLGLFVSSIVGLFEVVVAELPLIICFQSLILGMAGNAGTQSLAVTVRILSSDTDVRRERLRHIWKELRLGALNGLLLAGIAFFVTFLYMLLLKSVASSFASSVAGCISVALFLSVLIAGAVGAIVPTIFRRIGIDPAVASGPFITTLNDLVAVVVYYGLAWLLLLKLAI